MPNIVNILIRSTDATKPVMDQVEREYSESGKRAADNFTRDANGRLHDNLGKFVAEGEELGDGAGKGAGKKFSSSMSPLIMSVFAGAATEGPVALVAGAGVAVAGIAALVERSNADVASQYHKLGGEVSQTLTEAVAPFAGDIEKSITILDQGLSTVGPELKQTFAAAAPYSEDIAKSLVAIVTQFLPGFNAGLREAQPLMQILATFTGDIGKGIGGFVQELGTGSSGAAVGLKALGDALSHILPDVGQILGALSSGLGPALKDILEVATPVAGALAGIVSAFPPGVIQTAAVATAALFAAFKLASLAGILTEGASFLAFLKLTTSAEGVAALSTDALAASTKGLGAAFSFATGPIGILAAATTGLYFAISSTDKGTQGWDASAVKAIQTAVNQKAATDASTDAMSHQADVSDDLSIALNTAATAASDHAQKSATGTLAALGFTKGISGLTDSLYTSLTAFSADSSAASSYGSVLNAVYSKYATYSEAQAQFTEALAATAGQLTKTKNGFDVNTASGAKNFDQMNQLAQKNEQVAESFIAQGGSVDAANKKLQAGALQIDNIAKKAGFSSTQIAQLNTELYGTASIKDIRVNVDVNTAPAVQHVKNVIGWIDGQSASFYVNSTGPGARGAQAGFSHGGIVGAAVGGPRSGRIRVGETGPEDVDLPPGSFVHTNADTMSQGSSDGVARVELYWAGGSSDDWLFKAIRSGIRARLGSDPNSVQKVLGGNS